MTGDLPARVLAAIEETERIAQAATPGPWIIDRDRNDRGVLIVHETPTGPDDHVIYDHADWDETVRAFEHVVRHDPGAVLRRCAKDREIVEDCAKAIAVAVEYHGDYVKDYSPWSKLALRTLQRLAEGHGIEVGQ